MLEDIFILIYVVLFECFSFHLSKVYFDFIVLF